MKKAMISVNTCNTKNFGITSTPKKTTETKAFTLVANTYPTIIGFTKRTFILEYEENNLCCK